MGDGVTTIIVEPRNIVRAALAALMGKLTYRVVCSVATASDASRTSASSDGCKLAILGALSAEQGAQEALNIRKFWPDCKILLLLESASCKDLQGLMASQIDGCMPLYASADTLLKTLELIIVQELRVIIAGVVQRESKQGAMGEGDKLGVPGQNHSLQDIEDHAATIVMTDQSDAMTRAGAVVSTQRNDEGLMNGPSKRKLSEREVQILDSLVKGHANKVIARTCDISEATVKVHMKSILRKIRVANRTQAAVWALEHGYRADEPDMEP